MLDDRVPNSLAIWMGVTVQSEADFLRYFEGMDDLAANGPLQRDLGTNFIDPDWLFWQVTEGMGLKPIAELIEEVDCLPATRDLLRQAAQTRGLTQGNAFFGHAQARFDEDQPGYRYNGLLFLGNFPD